MGTTPKPENTPGAAPECFEVLEYLGLLCVLLLLCGLGLIRELLLLILGFLFLALCVAHGAAPSRPVCWCGGRKPLALKSL